MRPGSIPFLLAGLGLAAPAGAQGITLFGDARLGIGYNIQNDGSANLEPSRSVTVEREVTREFVTIDPVTGETVVGEITEIESREIDTVFGGADDLRAVSRVRFGVTMSGESDSGITFGATIRADNAGGGQGGTSGQRSGSVFVSGVFGTLTYGDTDGADYRRVGDPTGNFSLTGLGDFNELPFLSNGGGSDNDALQFLSAPEQRPTIRYDYDAAAFGVSVSTNRDLDAVAFGTSYTLDIAERRSLTIGGGYFDFEEYVATAAFFGDVEVPAGDQWAVSLTGRFDDIEGGVGYTSLDLGAAGTFDVLGLGGAVTFGAWSVGAYYSTVTNGDDLFGDALDGRDSFGASFAYDLGSGARVSAGVARSYGFGSVGEPGDAQYHPRIEAITVADFGINMGF